MAVYSLSDRMTIPGRELSYYYAVILFLLLHLAPLPAHQEDPRGHSGAEHGGGAHSGGVHNVHKDISLLI